MHQIRRRLRDASRTPRVLLPLVLLTFICLFGTWSIRETPSKGLERQIVMQYGGIYGILRGPAPSINLVIAATSKEDFSWVKKLKIPNLKVLPYIAGPLESTEILLVS